MERLSGLDASFLYMETPTLHMHVSMAAVFDPSTIRGGYSFDRVHDLVKRRLVQAPVFTRRLVQVPFRLGHPYWVDDPHFDIDFHLRRAALPAPGGMHELAEFVGDVCSRQLDRSKPLWQMYIVEGLENGNIALVTKMHHSTIDGVSGAELLAQLFDLKADPKTQPTTGSSAPGGDGQSASSQGRIPSDVELVAQALAIRLSQPPRIARLAWKTAFALLDVRKVRKVSDGESAGKAALPLTAPRTSINQAITGHRKVSFASISLDDVKRLKNAMGTTVNDVVLAICTGALRSYLQSREELPDSPLVATVPVSVHDAEDVQGSNRVSAMFVSLPTQIADPLERLATINKGTRGAKEEHNALGADVLLNWVEHATPNVFAAAARTYSRLKLADHHRPIHNLIISNVPGPDFPLYFAGAEMVAGFPLGPILEGAGLNITVMSYRGVLNWGLMACRETVAGADEIALAIPEALDELLAAAGLPAAVAVGVAPGRRTAALAKSTASHKSKSAGKKVESAKARSTKAPTAKARSPKAEEPKTEEPKTAEPKTEETVAPPQAAEAKTEEQKTEETVAAAAEPDHDPVVAVIGQDPAPERSEPASTGPESTEPDSTAPETGTGTDRPWLGRPPAVDTVADLLEENGAVPVAAHVTPGPVRRLDQSTDPDLGSSF
jgi:diacylglycerol O-acyltransferase / wax synthase